MLSRWEEASRSPLDDLVHQSRSIGAEEGLVLWGGGNNSVKAIGADPLGAPIPVMYVKGSGSDMKSIVADEYPAVRLDYVTPLMSRESMSDEEMVAYLSKCLVDPASRRPSIETLLHAFLPFEAVLHTHADAILAITNSVGREETVRACFGDRVLTVEYIRPGFQLSKRVGLLAQQAKNADGIVLMNHGLITWGATSREAYERHVELVDRAEAFVRREKTTRATAAAVTGNSVDRNALAASIRSAVLRVRPMVMEFDSSDETIAFLGREDLDSLTQIGPATPDHLLYTKRFPLLLQSGLDGDAVRSRFDEYARRYTEYFERNCDAGDPSCEGRIKDPRSTGAMLDPLPRVVLVRGVGMWTIGKDARAARIVRDIYRHTMLILTSAASLGGFATLSDRDAYDAEYWPLELFKLTLLPKERELASKIVIVTGAAGAIGRAIASRFAEEGAHLILHDRTGSAVGKFAAELVAKFGLRRAIGIEGDLELPRDVSAIVELALEEYGGLDVVVSNAGIAAVSPIDELSLDAWETNLRVNTTAHFLLVQSALRVFKRQGAGGVFVFNATKNVTAPGKDFGAYSVSKAGEAQLCRIVAIEGGPFGIRANMLNPDAVFDGSALWSDELKRQRAETYGISVEQLPEYYQKRNLLAVRVTAADVAEAALFLASARSAKTTGAMLPVDGGVREAFPR